MSLCVQLSLQGVTALVIGRGCITYRKCCQLEQEETELAAIAKQFDAHLQGTAYPRITDSYRPQQLQGKMLVLTCCDDLINNKQICEDVKQAGIFATSVRQNCGASMHALAVEEAVEYVLVAGTKGVGSLLARQMLKEMNVAVKKNYASRIAVLRKLCQYTLQHIQKEECPQLFSRLVRLSQRDLYCIEQTLQGKGLQLVCFHGVKEDVFQELENLCVAIEHRKTSLVAAAAPLFEGVSDTSAQSVVQWLQVVEPLHVPVTLVPMLF